MKNCIAKIIENVFEKVTKVGNFFQPVHGRGGRLPAPSYFLWIAKKRVGRRQLLHSCSWNTLTHCPKTLTSCPQRSRLQVTLSDLTLSCVFQSLRAYQRHIKYSNPLKLAVCNTDIGIYDLCISDLLYPGLCSTQIFRADSTLTHVTIQVTQLWLDSTLYFSWLTQQRLNSNPKFANLTQLWLNSFESELSQIWLTTHHILPNLAKSCWPRGGGGGGAVECSCRLFLSR